jgi:hypothetical protein
VATRFWLTSAAPPYTPTTRRGAWDVATGEDIQLLGRKPQGSAGTSSINVGSTAADRDILLHRSISAGAVKAGTLSGTVQWTIGVKESNVDLNGFWHLHVYVTSGDSDTPRGTLLTDYIGATEFTTTATGSTAGAQTVTPVAVQIGDRIVAEIGYRANALATTYNATINYGNVGGTDLASGDTAVTTEPGWIEFSGADGLFTPALTTLTDTFTTGVSGTLWNTTAGVSGTGGRARINCTTTLADMYTVGAYEIQGAQLAFQVPTLPAAGGGSTVTFSAYLSAGPTISNTNLEFEYSPVTGNLVLRNNVGGSDASPTTLTYNATSHAWWRFRETGGSLLMETSPDNTTWTTQRTIAAPTQWMRLGTLIGYFESQRSAGTSDFAEIDNVNPAAGHTIAVTPAAETSTAQTVGRAKALAPGRAADVDTAQTVPRTKRLTAAPAGSVDTAQTLARAKRATTAPATETSTAQTPGRAKHTPAGTATETSTARPATSTKTRSITAANSLDTATPAGAAKHLGTAPATETSTALGSTRSGRTIAVTPAAETSTGQTPGRAKNLTPGRPAELDTANGPTHTGHQLGTVRTGPPRTRWTPGRNRTRWTSGAARSNAMDRDGTELLQLPVYADTDPSSYPVRIAILPPGERPTTGDWHTAAWATVNGIPHAQLLIGPDGGAITLGPGTWTPWIDITATPEHPHLEGVAFSIT